MKRNCCFISFSIAITVFVFCANSALAQQTLRMATMLSTKTINYQALENMADYVNKKTNGEYVIKIFPSGQLGPTRETQQQLKMGTLDLLQDTNNGPTYLKEGRNFNATAAPFVFRSNDEYRKFLLSPLAKEMDSKIENGGIKIIGYLGFRSPRALTTTNTPVRVPEDLKGLKIRVPGMKSIRAFFQECGANPTPLPFTELFMALKTGVVEGQDNGIDLVEGQGFYEVQKYYMKLDHALGAWMLYASMPKWKTWPESLKKALADGAAVAAEFNNKELDKYQEVAYKRLKEKGMIVLDVDKPAFEAVAKRLWKKLDGDLWEKGFMAKVQKQLEEIR